MRDVERMSSANPDSYSELLQCAPSVWPLRHAAGGALNSRRNAQLNAATYDG